MMEFAAGKVKNLLNKISAFKQDRLWSISILFVVMLGVFVRLRLYFANNSLWMDEAALANNLLLPNSILDNMTYLQAAPPLFKLFSLINVKCFGTIEYAFRLLPLLAGILAIFFFYEIVKQVFAKKLTQLVAMFLFSLNISLISYAAEFKQYSSDVLMTLCLFLLVLKVDPFESRRKLIFLACMFAISFWFSHSALFVLCGIGCVYLLKILSSKLEIKTNILKLILLYLPSLISFCLFWCLHLKTIAASSGMHEYWVSYFINNFENLNFVIGEILQTYFFPCNSGFVLLLIIPSFLWIIKSKQNILEWMFFISPIVILFFLSYLKIYPFASRLCLFILPTLILLIANIFNFIERKHGFRNLLLIAFFFVSFWNYFTIYPKLLYEQKIFTKGALRNVYEYIQPVLKADDVIFFANDLYQVDKFYHNKFGFKNKIIKNTAIGEIKPSEHLRKNSRYWILYTAYSRNRCLEPLLKWMSSSAKILDYYNYYPMQVFYVEVVK